MASLLGLFGRRTLSPKQFGDKFRERHLRAYPDISLSRADDLSFALNGGQSGAAHLGYAYQMYERDPAQLDDILQRMVDLTGATIQQNSQLDTRSSLVALLRSKAYIENGRAYGASFVTRPFAGDLEIVLMIDLPTTLRTVDHKDLADAGLSEEEAFGVAATNLKARIGPITSDVIVPNQIVTLTAASDLVTGALIFPNLLEEEFGVIKEGSLFHVCDRNLILRSLHGSSEATGRFWAGAAPAIAEPDAYSRTPLTYRDGAWVEVKPPA